MLHARLVQVGSSFIGNTHSADDSGKRNTESNTTAYELLVFKSTLRTNTAKMPLQYFDTDGGRLAVEVEGEGPLVICSPGMGDHRDVYIPLASQLISEGYTVARMDNRGHGDSSTTFARFGDEATADDFLLLADKLGKGKRVVLAGDSFSGGSATIAAAKKPETLAGIILLCPFLRNPSDMAVWFMPLLFYRPWGPWMWQTYAKTLWPGLGSEDAAKRAADSRALLTRPGYWRGFQKTVAGLDHRKVGPWIPKAGKTPALVVMGDKDPDWSKPMEEAEWVANNFENHEVLKVEGAGHAPMLESPEVVGKGVKGFLEQLKKEGKI